MQEKLLIVDDTRTNLDILVDMLDNYDVIVSTNGIEALETVHENEIDLILLDIMMPGMDGYEVCSRLKENDKTKDIPVMFITAKSDDQSIEKGFDIGGVDYITKPFRAVELQSRIKTHLKLKRHEKMNSERKKFLALEKLIGNLVHHWRQPLSVISTMASGMSLEKEMGVLKDEIFYKNCNSIYDYTQELSLTLENLNSIVDCASDEKELYNLLELLNNNEFLFEDLKKDNIEIITNIDSKLEISVAKEQFLKILLNLFQNSRNAFSKLEMDKKYIFIDVLNNDDFISFRIKDNAKGINKDILENIFEPYFTSEHKSFGKGLGLYTVHSVISNCLKGRVVASNEKFLYNGEEQRGAMINIEIPKN